jgi:hypothetical protein
LKSLLAISIAWQPSPNEKWPSMGDQFRRRLIPSLQRGAVFSAPCLVIASPDRKGPPGRHLGTLPAI